MSVNRFEDLIAWQKARVLTRSVYGVTRSDAFSRDFGLSGQIQRAATSVMSNIAEGFDGESPKEFVRFLTIAKASCSEVRSQLYIALDVGYIDQTRFNELMAEANETSKVINGLRKSIIRKHRL